MKQKQEKNIQPEKNEETRIQKNEKRLRNFWDDFKYYNIWIIGVPEVEEEEQEIENLFEQIRKENFPKLVKEIDFQVSRNLTESQRNWTQRGTQQITSSLGYPRLKIKRES